MGRRTNSPPPTIRSNLRQSWRRLQLGRHRRPRPAQDLVRQRRRCIRRRSLRYSTLHDPLRLPQLHTLAICCSNHDPEIFNATYKLIPTISHNPRGDILGIIGLGNISKKFAYKAKTALGKEIHYFDVVRASVDEEHRLVATFHASLDKLLKGRGLHIPPYNSECIYTRSDRYKSSCIDEARI